jgi:hypothetical protein
MSYAYPHGGTAVPRSFSHRKHFVEPPNSPVRLTRKLLVTTRRWLAELHTNIRSSMPCLRCRGRRERKDLWREAWWLFRRGANFANAIILMWAFVLWWGERTVFESAVSTCLWETWEKWVRVLATFINILQMSVSVLIRHSSITAPKCNPTPCRLRCRSTIGRSSHLSRQTLAAL